MLNIYTIFEKKTKINVYNKIVLTLGHNGLTLNISTRISS